LLRQAQQPGVVYIIKVFFKTTEAELVEAGVAIITEAELVEASKPALQLPRRLNLSKPDVVNSTGN